jgi:hypothetical protein
MYWARQNPHQITQTSDSVDFRTRSPNCKLLSSVEVIKYHEYTFSLSCAVYHLICWFSTDSQINLQTSTVWLLVANLHRVSLRKMSHKTFRFLSLNADKKAQCVPCVGSGVAGGYDTALPVGGSRDRSPVLSRGIFSVATDGTMCPGVDSCFLYFAACFNTSVHAGYVCL